jgi:hypothetical protein
MAFRLWAWSPIYITVSFLEYFNPQFDRLLTRQTRDHKAKPTPVEMRRTIIYIKPNFGGKQAFDLTELQESVGRKGSEDCGLF